MSTSKFNHEHNHSTPSDKPGRDPRDRPAFQKGRGGRRTTSMRRTVRRPVRRAARPARRPTASRGISRRGVSTVARRPSRPVSTPPRRSVRARPKRNIPARRPLARPTAASRAAARRGAVRSSATAAGKSRITRSPARRPIARPRRAPSKGVSRAAPQQRAARPARARGSPVTLTNIQPRRSVAPELASSISSLNMSLNDLSSRASLADVQADAVAFDASLGELVDMLDDVRDRGYIYGKDLDERLNDVLGKWEAVQDQVYGQIETRSQALYDAIYPLEDAIYDASFNPRTGTINKMERRVGQQLRNAGRAESEIERLYSDAESEAGRLRAELGRIDWMMDQLDEASFELEEDEHPVAAVRTIYDLPGKKDDYEGALFLTNKRLIYEQKEEKATKKVLFITTEKELVQEVQFDVAAADISAAKSKKKGLLGREDHLLVTASGARVEESDFHLKGQDSNMWVQLLTRVQRGDIEEDKATSAGISVRDLSGPVTQASIVELQTDVNELQSRAALTFAKNTLGDMEAMVGNLERDLQDVRAGGYLFESDLEAQVESLTSQWDKVRDDVNDEISTQEAKLSSLMQDMQIRLADVVGYADNPRAVEPQARALRSLVATANTQAEAAEEAVFAKYRAFQEDVEELGSRFEWVDWMLGALAQASFRLYPTEGGVAACDALYRRPNMDDQAGALFLTDQRLVFEEHEGDFSVMIEVAVSQIENVEAEDTRGEDKEEEHLIVSFDSAAPVQKADFVLLGPTNEEWQLLIGRSRQGDFVNDRAEKIDPAELERLKNAPTNCTACGAAFTEPLLRGQTEISCQFCFTVNRV